MHILLAILGIGVGLVALVKHEKAKHPGPPPTNVDPTSPWGKAIWDAWQKGIADYNAEHQTTSGTGPIPTAPTAHENYLSIMNKGIQRASQPNAPTPAPSPSGDSPAPGYASEPLGPNATAGTEITSDTRHRSI